MKQINKILAFACLITVLLLPFNIAAQKKPTIDRTRANANKTVVTSSSTQSSTKTSSSKSSSMSTSKSSSKSSSHKKTTAKNNKSSKPSTKAKSSQSHDYITVDKDYLVFDADGGTRTIKVNAGGRWYVDVRTESWATLDDAGNHVTLSVNPNSSTSERNDYFVLRSGSKTKRINFRQSGKVATRLEVSQSQFNFSSQGGTRTVSITSNRNWQIGVKPASWVHVTRSGSQLQIQVDSNTGTSDRSDYFTITAADKSVRINIKQEVQNDWLTLSQDNISASSSGETVYIIVNTDGYWEIGTPAANWNTLTKNGNQLVVKVSPNNSNTSRTDYFTIRSGSQTKTVNISQAAASSYSSGTYGSYNYSGSSERKKRFTVGIDLFGQINPQVKGGDFVYSFGAGLIFRIGDYRDFLNFSFGGKWARLGCNLEEYYSIKGKIGDQVLFPANLKFNLFHLGKPAKFYIGGGYEYALGLSEMPDMMDWNAGIGINSRHVDWYIYYKQYFQEKERVFFENKYKQHIGTSLIIYF